MGQSGGILPCVMGQSGGILPCVMGQSGGILPSVMGQSGGILPCVMGQSGGILPSVMGQSGGILPSVMGQMRLYSKDTFLFCCKSKKTLENLQSKTLKIFSCLFRDQIKGHWNLSSRPLSLTS